MNVLVGKDTRQDTSILAGKHKCINERDVNA